MSTIRLAAGVDVGVATHTGHVRTDNEDDYLLLSLPELEGGVLIGAVADGMGGLAGGRDASRAAVRALGAMCIMQIAEPDGTSVLRAGFEAAAERLQSIASSNPRLADLGTTLTVLFCRGREIFVGHVGDSRCLRIRRGAVEQITEDHALEEPRHLLTRCLGAGQSGADGDFAAVEVQGDDVILLCTDGAWSVVTPEEIAAEFKGRSLQAGCEGVIRTVLARGAPDNATILALRIEPGSPADVRELELPTAEVRPPLEATVAGTLRRPRWPWLVLVLAILCGALAWARWRHGFDAWPVLRGWRSGR